MNNILKYKGYRGSIIFSVEDNCFWGKVLGVKGSNSYEGNNFEELNVRFKEAIDTYIEWCKEDGIEPETPTYNQLQINGIPVSVYLKLAK